MGVNGQRTDGRIDNMILYVAEAYFFSHLLSFYFSMVSLNEFGAVLNLIYVCVLCVVSVHVYAFFCMFLCNCFMFFFCDLTVDFCLQ